MQPQEQTTGSFPLPPDIPKPTRDELAIAYYEAVRRLANARNAERTAEDKARRARVAAVSAETDVLRCRRELDRVLGELS